jgi:hypothetical protein
VKHLAPGTYLLSKNSVKTDKKELRDGINGILKQKPNRKILGIFKFHLGVYTLANHGKPTKFKEWVKNTIGEEPVTLDTLLTARSSVQVKQFMQNEGFFNATVTDTTVYKRKKARVTYSVNAGPPYLIRNMKYTLPDTLIRLIVLYDSAACLVKTGNRFRTADFQAERERITRLLKNYGMYEFNQLFVAFDIDSSLKSEVVDVNYIISGPGGIVESADSAKTENHKIFRVKNIFVNTDYDPLKPTSKILADTTVYNGIYFISRGPRLLYKPESLLNRIYIESDTIYRINWVDRTYSGLAALGLFKFINVKFEAAPNDTVRGPWLNCNINLSPLPKQSYKLELEGTHNGGNFGIGGNITYTNKNIFRGGESFDIKFLGKVEAIPDFTDTIGEQRGIDLNTFELGPVFTLRIPRFLWPLKKYNRIRTSSPVSLFTAGYNWQQRSEYTRDLFLLSSGIEFRERRYIKHFIYPAEVSYTNYQTTTAFSDKLTELDDPQLNTYYESNFITNGRYIFIYNNQEPNLVRNFTFFRFGFEIAGNSLRLFNKLTNPEYNTDSTYKLLSVSYAQYIRPEIDLRFYQLFSENTSMIYRFATGIGFSYLNSDFLPYEKTFFAGGANDLRAFLPRTVGPGSYETTNYVEQLGDIKINLNFEYRFDIFKVLEGALFLDVGNIWLRNADSSRVDAEFHWDSFYKELAVGAGAGLRFDFQFFIFRVDAGFPFRYPSGDMEDRWNFTNLKLNEFNINLGIGYPF